MTSFIPSTWLPQLHFHQLTFLSLSDFSTHPHFQNKMTLVSNSPDICRSKFKISQTIFRFNFLWPPESVGNYRNKIWLIQRNLVNDIELLKVSLRGWRTSRCVSLHTQGNRPEFCHKLSLWKTPHCHCLPSSIPNTWPLTFSTGTPSSSPTHILILGCGHFPCCCPSSEEILVTPDFFWTPYSESKTSPKDCDSGSLGHGGG